MFRDPSIAAPRKQQGPKQESIVFYDLLRHINQPPLADALVSMDIPLIEL
jgi:hypothetical protein